MDDIFKSLRFIIAKLRWKCHMDESTKHMYEVKSLWILQHRKSFNVNVDAIDMLII
jgi:hypothetical protein